MDDLPSPRYMGILAKPETNQNLCSVRGQARLPEVLKNTYDGVGVEQLVPKYSPLGPVDCGDHELGHRTIM